MYGLKVWPKFYFDYLYSAQLIETSFLFRSSHFLFLVTLGDEVTKILHNLCLHFARQDGQDGKKQINATNVTKIPKSKRRKYGMNETIVL